jgi:hypothetical protein
MARDTFTGKTILGMKKDGAEKVKKDPQTPWTKIIVHPTGKIVQKGATWATKPTKKQVWVTTELNGESADELDIALEASRERHRAERKAI